MKKNILSGMRPTGRLHLGHYFGTLVNWVKLQEDYCSFFEIADVQALTDNYENPEKVRDNVREVAIDYLASGIDPEQSIIFVQSTIPEIAELTIYYSNLVTMSRLYRNPTVKSEIAQKKRLFGDAGESVTYGFVGYPVSQAADITIFDGACVPVGEDQLPLIEQAREIVHKFNHIYGETLTVPEPVLSKDARIKGLDGNEKMGKSLGNAIYLADSEEEIERKIMNAVTDTHKIKKDDPADPEVCMVYYYHKLINHPNVKTVCTECKAGERGCVGCKKELIQEMIHFLEPIQQKRHYYEQHMDEVDQILIEGSRKARNQAKIVMERIRKNMKIDYFKEDI